MNKILILHGGGPTAVMNCSLAGAVKAAKKGFREVYGAAYGFGGLLKENFINLGNLGERDFEALKHSPGSAIGSSRDIMTENDYLKALDILEKHGFDAVVLNGGNGTMNSASTISRLSRGRTIKVAGIPKTMDNDLKFIDHSPGFLSAATYLCSSVAELNADIKSLPIHVVILEVLGRNAGWLAASTSFCKKFNAAPDMILLPEKAFDEAKFLKKVSNLWDNRKGLLIVASEGLKDKDGNPITEPIFKSDRSVYFGDVGAHLSQLIVKNLGIKSRNEKPGLLSRASLLYRSFRDMNEAEKLGENAVMALLDGRNSVMSCIIRKDDSDSESKFEYTLCDLESLDLSERTVPDEYIDEEGFTVSEKFDEYIDPIMDVGADKSLALASNIISFTGGTA